MKATKFDRLVEHRFNICKAVLMSKDKEYSSEADRLHNFVRAGAARGRDPVTALDGMMLKHLVSVWDMIDTMEYDSTYIPDKAYIAEKIGDCINYLLLLEGLVEDRRARLEPIPIEEEF
ncbi:MAG: hypothetical protein DRJ03_02455 [Chloroflexi bacterium]|nr:MAG: hypothetical protein DRJ03_02455 [Chloroflexota bacterium]